MINNYQKIKKDIDRLYLTNKFFVKVKRKKSNKPNYWDTIIDPDGNIRKRITTSEKNRFKKNIKFELDYIKKLKPKNILDVGCGPGWFLSFLPQKIDKYGIEPDKEAANEASKYCKVYNDDFENTHFNKKFDLVFSHHVIEHVFDPHKFIIKIKSLLKKNGNLVISTPDFDSGCARRFKNKYRLLHDDTHVSLFTNDSMHRFLRFHNFFIKKVYYPYFDTTYFNKKNLYSMLKSNKISPPFYGNFMTFIASNK